MFKKIVIALIIIMFLSIVYSLIEPYSIETKEIVIESDQIPSEFDGATIVFLSDFHCGSWPFFDAARTEELVNQVNELNPDIILLGGDYVSDDPSYVNSTFSELSKLNAPLGVYGVLGNNDPKNETVNAMSDAGITYIKNGGLWVEKGSSKIRIGGVGDFLTDSQNSRTAIGNATENDFVVLLSHSPDFFPYATTKSKIDLMLSGHTHGGQITFFGLWAPNVHSKYGQEFRTGVKNINNITLVISNGIGTSILPARFFASPQIIVLKLKKK